MIAGDIKSHYVLSNLNLCVLNAGSNIYLHPGNGFYFSIDLTIVDSSLLVDLHWTVHDDLCESDHFPIIGEGSDPLKTDFTENWKLKVDWTLFESPCLQIDLVENLKASRILFKNLQNP